MWIYFFIFYYFPKLTISIYLLIKINSYFQNKNLIFKEKKYIKPVYYHNLSKHLKKSEFKSLSIIQKLKNLINHQFINSRMIDQDTINFFWFHATVAELDINLCYLASVHFNLYAGSVLRLGSSKHHKYLEGANQEDIGCFALTEKAYGVLSGLKVGTRAIYDDATQEYILHTPESKFAKNWITNGGQYATHGVVFALLKDKVRAFVIPIRERSGTKCYSGIMIQKIKDRSLLTQVDNAIITFKNYHISKDCLLDAPMDNNRNYFQQLANQLLSGRLCIASAAVHLARNLLENTYTFKNVLTKMIKLYL